MPSGCVTTVQSVMVFLTSSGMLCCTEPRSLGRPSEKMESSARVPRAVTTAAPVVELQVEAAAASVHLAEAVPEAATSVRLAAAAATSVLREAEVPVVVAVLPVAEA